jgi:hypothetical protein
VPSLAVSWKRLLTLEILQLPALSPTLSASLAKLNSTADPQLNWIAPVVFFITPRRGTSKTRFCYCCLRVRFRGNVFTEPLLRNGRLFISLLPSNETTHHNTLKDTLHLWARGIRARGLSDCVEGSCRDRNYARKYPRLDWAGWKIPWFQPLTEEEIAAVIFLCLFSRLDTAHMPSTTVTRHVHGALRTHCQSRAVTTQRWTHSGSRDTCGSCEPSVKLAGRNKSEWVYYKSTGCGWSM